MATISKRSWMQDAPRLGDPALLREVLRNPDMSPGKLGDYLQKLSDCGVSLPHFSAMVRHSFIFLGGPDHLELRRRVTPFFSASAVERWRPTIVEAVENAIGTLRAATEPDLMRDFAEPAFNHVIRKVAGIPEDAPSTFLRWAITANDATEPMLSISELRRIDAAMGEIAACLVRSSRPEGSLIASLAPSDHPLALFNREVSIAISIIIAAVTMLQTLGFALNGLLLRPEADWQRIADPTQRQDILEEVLSLYLSTLLLGRVAEKDVEVGGCPFSRDQTVTLDIRHANETLRQKNGPQAHMSFGFGPHKCVGEHLARVFLDEALPRLANAFPHLSVHRDLIRHNRTSIVQSPSALPCVLDNAVTRINPRIVEIRSASDARPLLNDDEAWSPPDMVTHLEALARARGDDLSDAIRFARNAPFFLSGERHATMRQAVFDRIGGNRLDLWQPVWNDCIVRVLDALEQEGTCDLINDFVDPVFKQSVKPVLGIRPANTQRFDALAPLIQRVLHPLLPLRELLEVQSVMRELVALLSQTADVTDPGLLGALMSQEIDGLDDVDKTVLVSVLYGASFNIRHTLGNVMHHVLSLPAEQRNDLLDMAGPTEIDRLIGLCAAPKYIYRTARSDMNPLAVARGTTLRFRLASLNRKAPAGHLAFGHGLHRCFGAAMARRIIGLALPAFFKRFPNAGLDPQQHRYAPMTQTIALESLPCILNKHERIY